MFTCAPARGAPCGAGMVHDEMRDGLQEEGRAGGERVIGGFRVWGLGFGC